MTILVDPLRKWPSGVWCHMGTDDHTEAGLDELHAMAARSACGGSGTRTRGRSLTTI